MFARNRFWWWFGGTTVFATLHPLGVYLASPGEAGATWVKNDPAMCGFVPALLPWIVAIAAAILFPDIRENFPRELARLWSRFFAALVLVAFFLILLPDLRRTPVEPYVLADWGEAAGAEMEERAYVRGEYASLTNPTKELDKLSAISKKAVDDYVKSVDAGFTGFIDFMTRASFSGWTKFLINGVVSVVVPFYFSFLLAVGYATIVKLPAKFNLEALLVAITLFILWFPARLYTEWYLHFFTFAYLPDFAAFALLIVVAFISLAWMVFILKPSRAVVTIPAIVSVFTTVFSIIAAIEPAVLWAVLRTFDKMAFEYVVALGAIVIACTTIVVSAIMRRRESTATAEPVNPS